MYGVVHAGMDVAVRIGMIASVSVAGINGAGRYAIFGLGDADVDFIGICSALDGSDVGNVAAGAINVDIAADVLHDERLARGHGAGPMGGIAVGFALPGASEHLKRDG